MKKGNKLIQFGEDVEGYSIPVLNEREIRASAGIIFVLLFISWMRIIFEGNFLMVKYVIIVFFTDLVIRVFINPKFSPTLIIGRLIVSRQVPEYVGAPQKKFAWKIGIGLSGLMLLLLVILNTYSIITTVSCLLCLAFLFFESAFGICFGCIVYRLFYNEKAQYCAGDICDTNKTQQEQKISWVQILIIFLLILIVILLFILFNNSLSESLQNLWGIVDPSENQIYIRQPMLGL